MEPNVKCPIHGDEHERSQCKTESVKLIFPQGEVTVKFFWNIVFGMHKCDKKSHPSCLTNIASNRGGIFWLTCLYCGLSTWFVWDPDGGNVDNFASLISQSEARGLAAVFK